MGAADVVPGVSGGTMALILGIYERLLNAIKSFDLIWIRGIVKLDLKTILGRPDFVFLIPLLAGIFGALLFFTRVVPLPQLILTHPELIYGLFFGLIVASIIVLFTEHKVFGVGQFVLLCVGVVTGYFLVTLVPFDTPNSTIFIFFAGMIAITAMILPGISGSFILLILHKYSTILGAVANLDFSILLPFALGCVTGVALFSRVLSWLLRHYYYSTLIFIKGILIASLWVIWPFQERVYVVVHEKNRLISSSPEWPSAMDATLLASVACMVGGFALVMLINYLASHRKSTA